VGGRVGYTGAVWAMGTPLARLHRPATGAGLGASTRGGPLCVCSVGGDGGGGGGAPGAGNRPAALPVRQAPAGPPPCPSPTPCPPTRPTPLCAPRVRHEAAEALGAMGDSKTVAMLKVYTEVGGGPRVGVIPKPTFRSFFKPTLSYHEPISLNFYVTLNHVCLPAMLKGYAEVGRSPGTQSMKP
jgi:hypothetical protein